MEIIPNELSNLTKIETIFITNSRVKFFPSHLTKLPILINLFLGGNLIQEVPNICPSFPKLERIVLNKNITTKFPKSLYLSRSLNFIHLDYNKIKSFNLPSKNRTFLQLFMKNNLIEALPDFDNKESRVEKLDLSYNKIELLMMMNLDYLKRGINLILRSNKIAVLPSLETISTEQFNEIGKFDLKGNLLPEKIKKEYKDFFKHKIRI